MRTREPATIVTAELGSFGRMPDGRDVACVTLARSNGVLARVIAYGATLQALEMPDRDGERADICIGHDTLSGYLGVRDFFGVTIGRVAYRIAGGRFRFDGHDHAIPVNNGAHSLHGGAQGFDTRLWEVAGTASGGTGSVTLRYVSPAGEMGYPGTLTTTATYALDARDQLTIEYRATTDAPTPGNLTHHALWNLAGAHAPRDAMGHMLMIPADRYTPTDATAIPTGALAPVDDTAFDFRIPAAIGARVRDGEDQQLRFGRGYDHNWVLAGAASSAPHLMARLADPVSGRGFELWSNQPGLQFYSGNFLDGTTRAKGTLLRQGDAIALEPQGFPDAPNQPTFPSIRLDPGQEYRNLIIYKFGIDFR